MGSAALNIVNYADMAVRGRGASDVPAMDVEKLADNEGPIVNLTRRIKEAVEELSDLDWRLHDLVITPVERLQGPPSQSR